MNRYIISILIAIAITTSSCKKNWLDKKSDKNLVVPESLRDFQALLDNESVMNSWDPGLNEIGSDGHYITDQAWNSTAITEVERNGYTWSNLSPYRKVFDWNNSYQKVFYANVALDGLEKLKTVPTSEKQSYNNIKGQALFQRARNFYQLAQLWAMPFSTSQDSEFGIPLRLSSDLNIVTTRSTVHQTYSQILTDLIQAIDLLPIIPLYKIRGSKPAAFALLARTYLVMQDYDNAKKYADSCLNLYNTLIDYNTRDSTLSYPFGDFNPEVIFHSRITFYSSITSNLRIDTSIYNSYAAGDLRKPLYCRKNIDGSISFRGSYTQGGFLFGGVASDEVYLIRAECNARKGNTVDAINDLNTLLQKRWKTGTFIPVTAINAEDALNKIINERKKELLFRGLRWSDLRRLNNDSRFTITINRLIVAQSYLLSPGSFKYTLPIPDDIIQQAEIKQNPGW